MSYFIEKVNQKFTVLSQLFYYILLLLKQSIIYIIFALDFIGIFLTYFTKIQIPNLVLFLLPLLAIFLAAFNIYRKSASELKLVLSNIDDIKFEFAGGHKNLTQNFSTGIKGYIANFGSHSGIFDNYEYESGINGCFDEFILDKININLDFSKIKNIDSNKCSDPVKDLIKFPAVLAPGSMVPFKIFLELYINFYNQEKIEKAVDWIKEINFKIEYLEIQKGFQRKKYTLVKIPTKSINVAIAELKLQNQK